MEFCQVTTLFFWKFCFSWRTSYKELIWCTNNPNVHNHTLLYVLEFHLSVFFPVNIPNRKANLPLETISIPMCHVLWSHLANIRWSWRRLQHVFSVTILRLPRRLEDMSWRRLEDLSSILLEDMSWKCLEDISWRRLEDTMEKNKILTGDLTNLYVYLTIYISQIYIWQF